MKDDTCPAVDPDTFKQTMSLFATGVTVVAALDGQEPVGFTCQSFMSLSLEPPLVALAPARTSTSWPRIVRAGAFCVNVLSENQAAICRAFAVSGANKFADVHWHPGTTGAPVIEGSLAWIECQLEAVHDAGDHEIVIGRVVDLKLGLASASPLLYFQRHFAALSPHG